MNGQSADIANRSRLTHLADTFIATAGKWLYGRNPESGSSGPLVSSRCHWRFLTSPRALLLVVGQVISYGAVNPAATIPPAFFTRTIVRQAEAALETLKSFPSRRFHLPIRIGIVGLTKVAAGDADGALALFEAALDVALTTGERWYEPELLRFKAEMLLIQPKQRATEAEQCLKAAIALAQQQEAKFWELRATTALAKLRAHQGCSSEARDLLAPVYGCFTEGFNTLDLKEAKALLDELTS
jgi:hypothetical protein